LLAAQNACDGLCDEDASPAVPQTPNSKLGDLWLLGRHRLLCGGSTDHQTVSCVLGSVKPTLLVTDQPYGVEYGPEWRKRAGVNNSNRMGRVRNDDRSGCEAWALFPGDGFRILIAVLDMPEGALLPVTIPMPDAALRVPAGLVLPVVVPAARYQRWLRPNDLAADLKSTRFHAVGDCRSIRSNSFSPFSRIILSSASRRSTRAFRNSSPVFVCKSF
jgi:hypothetical protein